MCKAGLTRCECKQRSDGPGKSSAQQSRVQTMSLCSLYLASETFIGK